LAAIGSSRACKALSQAPAREIVDELFEQLTRFAAAVAQEDDITVVALRYRGHANRRVVARRTLPRRGSSGSGQLPLDQLRKQAFLGGEFLVGACLDDPTLSST